MNLGKWCAAPRIGFLVCNLGVVPPPEAAQKTEVVYAATTGRYLIDGSEEQKAERCRLDPSRWFVPGVETQR